MKNAVKAMVAKTIPMVPYLGNYVVGLQNRVAELIAERDSLIPCGRATPKDERHSPDYSTGTNLSSLISGYFDPAQVRMLEIGSRNVTGKGYRWEGIIDRKNYVGFDVIEGENVDVVGDAHQLSNYFESESFDIVFSSAVFEHLAMPWIVAEEITKILRPGGLVITFTHFSYAEHELPWHFFQFNKAGLRALFNSRLGYEEIENYHALPMVGRFAYGAGDKHRGRIIGGLYCSTHQVARKTKSGVTGKQPDHFDWRGALEDVYQGTQYPNP